VVAVRAVRRQLERWAAVTVLPAIQGYGKTTAVAEWLRSQQPPFAWRTVWLTASDGLTGGVDRRLVDLLGEGRADPPRSPLGWPGLGLLDSAVGRLVPGQRFVLVIDDAHLVRDQSYLRDLVDVVARHDRLHLVMCARTQHPIVSIATGRVETVVVRPSDLLLRVDDIRALARSMAIPLQLEQAADLHERVGGWPAAVRLVLEAAAADADPSRTELPISLAETYLRDVVLPGIEDQVTLAELTRLSLTDRLTHDLVRDVSEHADPEGAVERLEALGVVERRYESDGIVLEMPSLVRATLRSICTSTQPDRAQELHGRLAQWFAEHDGREHSLHAMRHAVAAGNLALIDAIWVGHSAELALDHATELVDVLAGLPADVVVARPGMSVALETGRALRRVDGSRQDAPASVERRAVALRRYADSSRRVAASGLTGLAVHDLLSIGTGEMIALRLEGRFGEATAYAKALENRVASLVADGGDAGDLLAWFQFQSGVTRTLRAQSAAAIRHYQRTWRMRGQTTRLVAAHAAANLALTHAVLGAAQPARFWLGRLATLGSEPCSDSPFADHTAGMARGVLALDRLDREACEAELRLLNHDRPFELWPYAACLIAQHGLHHRDAAMSLAILDAAQSGWSHLSTAEPSAATLLLARARADLLLAAGQGQRALAALMLHDAERIPVLAVPLARLNLLAGDPLEARRIAADLLWTDTVDQRSRQELLLIKAVAAHRMGDTIASGEQARRALALYEHTGLLRPFATFDRAELESLFAHARHSLSADDLALVSANPSPFPSEITLVRLTPRERLLASALATSGSRQQIADELYVSVNTVRTQLATLYRKLEVGTRQEALARLAGLGLVPKAEERDVQVGPREAS
jgi:LuxR family maltose regulon positive regulatory protein